MGDLDILGMPSDLFDEVTEMVADRDSGSSSEDYDFAHSIAKIAYAHARNQHGD